MKLNFFQSIKILESEKKELYINIKGKGFSEQAKLRMLSRINAINEEIRKAGEKKRQQVNNDVMSSVPCFNHLKPLWTKSEKL